MRIIRLISVCLTILVAARFALPYIAHRPGLGIEKRHMWWRRPLRTDKAVSIMLLADSGLLTPDYLCLIFRAS